MSPLTVTLVVLYGIGCFISLLLCAALVAIEAKGHSKGTSRLRVLAFIFFWPALLLAALPVMLWPARRR